MPAVPIPVLLLGQGTEYGIYWEQCWPLNPRSCLALPLTHHITSTKKPRTHQARNHLVRVAAKSSCFASAFLFLRVVFLHLFCSASFWSFCRRSIIAVKTRPDCLNGPRRTCKQHARTARRTWLILRRLPTLATTPIGRTIALRTHTYIDTTTHSTFRAARGAIRDTDSTQQR